MSSSHHKNWPKTVNIIMLSKFVNWLSKKDYNPIVEGVFGSWTYHVPEDKKQQMYDFYMLEYLLPPGIKLYITPLDFGGEDTDKANALQNKELAAKGLPPDERPYGDMSRTTEDKFNYALYEVADKLLPTLKKELLEGVIFSIAAEVRHVYDAGEKPVDVIEKVRQALGEKEAKMLREYTIALKGMQNPDISPLMKRRPVPKDAKKSGKDYKTSYRAMKRAGGTDEDWAKLASWLFSNIRWPGSFGGPAWASIADGWLHLNNAKGASMLTYIDHVFDLQHNTGSVFTKLKGYQKESGYDWIQEALDHKRDLVSPFEMFEHISPSMRELAKIGIKLKTGQTWPDFEKDWPNIIKKKAAIYNQMAELKYEKEKEKAAKLGYTYYGSKPIPLTPEQYAKTQISTKSVLNPETGKYEPPLYSMGEINKEYLKKLTKEQPPVKPSYSGTPIPEHDKKVKIGDEVEIISAGWGWIGKKGEIVEQFYKGGFPYYKIKFDDGQKEDFKREQFKIAKAESEFKKDDKVTITGGAYKGHHGVIKDIQKTNGLGDIFLVAMDNNKENILYFSKSEVKKYTAGQEPAPGDEVVITKGSHAGFTGTFKSKAGSAYLVDLNLAWGEKQEKAFELDDLNIIDKKPWHGIGAKVDEGPVFNKGDKVTITGGAYKGHKGIVQFKVPSFPPDYSVLYSLKLDDGSYPEIHNKQLEKTLEPKIDENFIVSNLKSFYEAIKPYMLPQDLKVARALVFANVYSPHLPIKTILGFVNKAINSNYNPSQLVELEKLYEKEKVMKDYFEEHLVYDTPIKLDAKTAHDIFVKHFPSVPGKPFLDKSTIMKAEDLIESGQIIPVIKLLRAVLGWTLKSAKAYAQYIMLELAMNGIEIQKPF